MCATDSYPQGRFRSISLSAASRWNLTATPSASPVAGNFGMIRARAPLPLGEGGATASGLARRAEGRAEREPDRAKPQEKSNQILRSSPYPLPEGEGDSKEDP